MLELGNIIKTGFAAWVINGAYNGIEDSTKSPDDDAAVAVIRELLRGNIAGIRQSAHNANEAVSMMQMFTAAAATIGEKLGQMKELAEEAATGYCTDSEKADMQEEFEELAEEINDVVESTEYDGNKLFTANGETISVSIGNSSTIDIFSKDLSLDIDGLDLTADADSALASIRGVIEDVSEYSEYISRQVARLEDAMAVIEFDMAGAMGLDSSGFDMNVARQVAGYAASKVLEDVSILFDVQANVIPKVAAGLLEYTGEYVWADIEEDTE